MFIPSAQARTDSTEREILNSRQLQILPLLADGMANNQIADALNVAEGTIKQHMKELFKRLNARNRTQAVQEARRLGLLRK
ncbi:MAG: response regulator transcription factor [Betaproteobacteria bacterium]|nr:response regulator transcription factor [Betaproteobacteria bacterium]